MSAPTVEDKLLNNNHKNDEGETDEDEKGEEDDMLSEDIGSSVSVNTAVVANGNGAAAALRQQSSNGNNGNFNGIISFANSTAKVSRSSIVASISRLEERLNEGGMLGETAHFFHHLFSLSFFAFFLPLPAKK